MEARLHHGGGAAHVNPPRLSPYVPEPERMSKQRQGAGCKVQGLCAPGRARRSATGITEHGIQAHPKSVQCDVGRTRSAPSSVWRNICLANAVVRFNLE